MAYPDHGEAPLTAYFEHINKMGFTAGNISVQYMDPNLDPVQPWRRSSRLCMCVSNSQSSDAVAALQSQFVEATTRP